ncbi:hypothetical protein, partial [Helicobacter typhlonius]|uniref:hypothetical protein n=1 Tax=Helicobacter typhlonius TaxID=76936 RepID=UPI002FE18942
MNDYFQARGVNPQMYKNTKLPAYFKEVIESLPSQSKVLDFGCGFGQNLLALKEKNFDFSGGGGGKKKKGGGGKKRGQGEKPGGGGFLKGGVFFAFPLLFFFF